MEKRELCIISLIQLLLIPAIIFGQSANETFYSTADPDVFKNDKGAVIEYLGMQQWAAKEIQDSLKALAPNRPVHACMAVLKKNLGFAGSAVLSYLSGDKNSMYTVVTVVEDRDKLNPVPVPINKKPIIKRWVGKLELENRRNQNLLSNGIQFFEKKDDGSLTLNVEEVHNSSFISEEDSKFLITFYNHLKEQDSEKDRALVHKTIQEDGNILNRILASVVLLNFDNTQEEKYMMLSEMRSENPQIARFSAATLSIMVENGPEVDWSGATESIRALLAGTNLPNLRTTLKILEKTKISPSLADRILTDNTFLLEERLKARHEKTRKETLVFVNQLSGTKFTNAAGALEWLSQY